MNVVHFECVGGASGDMILGALLELGIDPADLQKDLATLPIEPFELAVDAVMEGALRGTRVTVRLHETAPHHAGHAAARGLNEIREMISASRLPEPAKAMSLRVFSRIAEAEAKVHGTTPEKIHFHEVGALDSIIDIVGCCLGLHRLGVAGVAVGPFPAGRGVIQCAHGTFPNPAPATVELLRGLPILQTDEERELVTPTGAALLSTWRTMDAPPPGSRIARIGYSVGHHRLDRRPNLLRATLLEAAASAPGDGCLVLECNLDDTTPELIGSLTFRLMEAGALDAFTTAIQMKKQRPGVLLTVLCRPDSRDRLLDLIFRESTTLGVREHETRRTTLERRVVEIATPYGAVRIKIGRWRGDDVTLAPEMEDCIARAGDHGVPVRTVYEAAVRSAAALRTIADPRPS